jgi:integrase
MKRPPKFVQGFVDRHGRARFYFRRVGFKNVPLPGLPWSPEFMAAYETALTADSAPGVVIGASRSKPGTVGALVAAYFAHGQNGLADETKRKRRHSLEHFREQHGDKRVALLQPAHIVNMLNLIKKPHAQKNWLKSVRALMRFAVSTSVRADDPTDRIKTMKVKSDGIRTWSEEDIAQFRAHHAVGTQARLALELLLDTGQRGSDIVRMGRQHLHDGLLRVRQKKTGSELLLPIDPDLQDILASMPNSNLTFLTTANGAPFTASNFGFWFHRMRVEAGLPAGLTAHGLRKAACRRLAEAGRSANEIASISGHKSLREVERYTRAADQVRMAKSAKAGLREALARGTETETPSVKPLGLKLSNRS